MGDAIWENRGVDTKPHPFLFGEERPRGKEMDIWIMVPELANQRWPVSSTMMVLYSTRIEKYVTARGRHKK